jgi:hypothetical protein
MTVPLAGGTPVTLASGQQSIDSIAVDASGIYWVNSRSTLGTVMKLALGGGTPVTLAAGQDLPFGLAVDSTSVYWATFNGGTRSDGRSKIVK